MALQKISKCHLSLQPVALRGEVADLLLLLVVLLVAGGEAVHVDPHPVDGVPQLVPLRLQLLQPLRVGPRGVRAPRQLAVLARQPRLLDGEVVALSAELVNSAGEAGVLLLDL